MRKKGSSSSNLSINQWLMTTAEHQMVIETRKDRHCVCEALVHLSGWEESTLNLKGERWERQSVDLLGILLWRRRRKRERVGSLMSTESQGKIVSSRFRMNKERSSRFVQGWEGDENLKKRERDGRWWENSSFLFFIIDAIRWTKGFIELCFCYFHRRLLSRACVSSDSTPVESLRSSSSKKRSSWKSVGHWRRHSTFCCSRNPTDTDEWMESIADCEHQVSDTRWELNKSSSSVERASLPENSIYLSNNWGGDCQRVDHRRPRRPERLHRSSNTKDKRQSFRRQQNSFEPSVGVLCAFLSRIHRVVWHVVRNWRCERRVVCISHLSPPSYNEDRSIRDEGIRSPPTISRSWKSSEWRQEPTDQWGQRPAQHNWSMSEQVDWLEEWN